MGDPLRDYKTGEHLEAATVTALTKAERARRDKPNAPKIGPDNLSPVRVLIRNSTGAAIERFAVLGIDGLAIERADNERDFDATEHVILDGVEPEEPASSSSSDAGHVGKFAVVQEPIEDGKLGIAIVSGVTKVQIDIQDEDDQFADIADGDVTQLKSGASGAARILWKEEASGSSEGTVWAVVIIGAGGGDGTLTPIKTLSPGSGATAATDSWSLEADKKAVSVEITTRDYYDIADPDNPVLYYFTRLFTWDSIGILRTISVETQHTTDTPDACDV